MTLLIGQLSPEKCEYCMWQDFRLCRYKEGQMFNWSYTVFLPAWILVNGNPSALSVEHLGVLGPAKADPEKEKETMNSKVTKHQGRPLLSPWA